VAVVTVSALIVKSEVFGALRYLGKHSIVVYLRSSSAWRVHAPCCSRPASCPTSARSRYRHGLGHRGRGRAVLAVRNTPLCFPVCAPGLGAAAARAKYSAAAGRITQSFQ